MISPDEQDGRDQIVLSGIIGLRPDGTRPATFADEARQAWANVGEALHCAGAGMSDIVRVRTWLAGDQNLASYSQLCKQFILHTSRCQSTVVARLDAPDLLLEIEVVVAIDDPEHDRPCAEG